MYISFVSDSSHNRELNQNLLKNKKDTIGSVNFNTLVVMFKMIR